MCTLTGCERSGESNTLLSISNKSSHISDIIGTCSTRVHRIRTCSHTCTTLHVGTCERHDSVHGAKTFILKRHISNISDIYLCISTEIVVNSMGLTSHWIHPCYGGVSFRHQNPGSTTTQTKPHVLVGTTGNDSNYKHDHRHYKSQKVTRRSIQEWKWCHILETTSAIPLWWTELWKT